MYDGEVDDILVVDVILIGATIGTDEFIDEGISLSVSCATTPHDLPSSLAQATGRCIPEVPAASDELPQDVPALSTDNATPS